MAINIASLLVRLGLDSAELTKGLKKSSKDSKSWAKDVKASAGIVTKNIAFAGAAAGVAAAGFAALFLRTSESVAQQQKLAERLGTTVSSIQVLGSAAQKAGVNQDGLNDTLADFVERLGEAKVDGGEPAEALQSLGLEAEKLLRQDPAAALRDVLDQMAKMPDAGVRAATAAKLFGDAGIELTTNARRLSDEIETATQKIDALGGGLSTVDAKQIEAAADALDDIQLAAGLSAQKITAKLAPGVEAVAKQFFEAATQGQQFEETVDQIVVGTLRGVSTIAEQVSGLLSIIAGNADVVEFGVIGYLLLGRKGALIGALLGSVSETLGVTADKIKGIFTEPETEADALNIRLRELNAELKNSAENTGFLGETIGGFLNGAFYGDETEIRAEIGKIEARLVDLGAKAGGTDLLGSAAQASSNFFDKLASSIGTVADAYGEIPTDITLPEPLDPVSGSVGEIQAASAARLAANQDFYTAEIIAYKTYQALRNEADANSEAGEFDRRDRELSNNEGHYARLIDQYNEYLASRVQGEEIAAEFEADQAALDRYFAYRTDQESQFQNTWTAFQAAGSSDRLAIFTRETSSALSVFAQHSKAFFKLNKAVGIANAVVSTAVGVTKALELPFPASLFAAAKVALEGAAQLVQIKSAQFGGGSVTQPGSGGGGAVRVDAPTVAATPSNSASDQPTVAGEAQQATSIYILNGLFPNTAYDEVVGDSLRRLSEEEALTDADGRPLDTRNLGSARVA